MRWPCSNRPESIKNPRPGAGFFMLIHFATGHFATGVACSRGMGGEPKTQDFLGMTFKPPCEENQAARSAMS